MEKILVIGACGQLGSELTLALVELYGAEHIIATDISQPLPLFDKLYFESLDVLDQNRLDKLIDDHHVTQIYHLAAVLSATGEARPRWAWQLNMDGLLNVLEVARLKSIQKVFWPSSIAAFGPNTPKANTPQNSVMDPSTVYGISKLSGELWCKYYYDKFQLDVRSLRYPGLISYKTAPGGGTTDYAIDIFHKAIAAVPFECFLEPDTRLPMMYMPDAVRATIELMQAPSINILERTSYNLSALNFSPKELANAVSEQVPGFEIIYKPDYRQQIAASWPQSIDDQVARDQWGWQPEFDLTTMTSDMLENLKELSSSSPR
ncbi:MAG: NAD-dependent epimerase/dehydratase family protein [Cyclobacteriaceae bacterium]